jgi:hypothetical protein
MLTVAYLLSSDQVTHPELVMPAGGQTGGPELAAQLTQAGRTPAGYFMKWHSVQQQCAIICTSADNSRVA